MRKISLLLLACLAGVPVFGQNESWKDSVKTKGKVTQAYYDDNVIYFRTKKGWGIYDRDLKKVLVEPVHQFVKRMGAGPQPGIFYVQQNLVGFMDLGGAVKDVPVFKRLGFAEKNEVLLKITNDKIVNAQKQDESWGRYPLTDHQSEYSVAVHNGRVYVNQYATSQPAPFQRVLPDGTVIDSVDQAGNVVYSIPSPDNRSMVFDLKTGEWLVKKGEASHVGQCRNNIIISKEEIKNGRLSHLYSVLNHEDQVRYKLGSDTVNNKKSVLKILGDYHPTFLYCIDSSRFSNVFIFESAGQYGVYDPWGMQVLVEPEYDFVYVPHESSRVFTVKKGKIGMLDLLHPGTVYENQYEALKVHRLKGEVELTDYMGCNGTSFEKDRLSDAEYREQWKLYPDQEFLPQEDPIWGLWKTREDHEHAGLEIAGNRIIVHDYTPVRKENYIDMNTEQYLEMNIPGHCYGGVFDPAARKWIVPPKFGLIKANEQGYACKNSCAGYATYSFFNKEGKIQMENKHMDSLKKDASSMARFLYPLQGQPKTNWIANVREGNTCIASANRLYGIYDLASMEWRVDPVHQYVDYNALAGFHTIVDSGKIGILDSYYELLVPALYTHVQWFPQEQFCANDTFLYSIETKKIVAITDTLKNPEAYFANGTWSNTYLNIEIAGNKLYTGEEYVDPERAYYDEYGTILDVKTLDTARTNVVDLNSGSRIQMDKGWVLREWDKGYLTRDVSGMIRAYDQQGKNAVELYDKDSAGCNGKWFWHWETDERFYYDPQGKIVQPDKVETLYFMHNYQPVGYAYHYFDGKKFLEVPKELVVMCASQSGLLLGYEVVTDPKTRQFKKQYRYYDPQTKKYSAVELELADGPVKVYPVKDGFALLVYHRDTKQYTCMVLEDDLRTVKSSFKKLSGYRAEPADKAIHPVPYYELYTDKKIMYFDRDFQFLHECNYQDEPQRIMKFNRIMLKSKFKTMVVDRKGRILGQ